MEKGPREKEFVKFLEQSETTLMDREYVRDQHSLKKSQWLLKCSQAFMRNSHVARVNQTSVTNFLFQNVKHRNKMKTELVQTMFNSYSN